ncbi:MAG: hypothetical protein R3293_28815 [Candidatus Promineifilaceae bacterium]|nr:hypothetical protein [Candidatus Promineifilaceae bacterium]
MRLIQLPLLENWHHERRTLDIVQLIMNGNTVHLTIDVADQGEVWAQQRVKAEVEDGMIQSLEVIETRLTLWRIHW